MSTQRSKAWSRLCVCAVLCIGAHATLLSTSASAFSDLFRFNDPAAHGGGGGRWFTGSPAEGYGCEVCHSGPHSESIVVQGLPEIYQLGATYDMYVAWPAAAQHVTAIVELTDETGHGAGTVSLPESALAAAETCQPVEQGIPAAIVLSGAELGLAGERQLIGMQDCGGNLLHWHWTAPTTDLGPVLFSGGLVEPDQHQNAEGDHGARFTHAIGSPSRRALEIQLNTTCSLGTLPESPAGAGWLLVACALWFGARRSVLYSRRGSAREERHTNRERSNAAATIVGPAKVDQRTEGTLGARRARPRVRAH